MEEEKVKEITERVVVSRKYVNLFAMQVCAVKDATDEEILEVSNRDNICGTSRGWCSVIRGKEQNEKSESWPVQCLDYPDRLHFLVTC